MLNACPVDEEWYSRGAMGKKEQQHLVGICVVAIPQCWMKFFFHCMERWCSAINTVQITQHSGSNVISLRTQKDLGRRKTKSEAHHFSQGNLIIGHSLFLENIGNASHVSWSICVP